MSAKSTSHDDTTSRACDRGACHREQPTLVPFKMYVECSCAFWFEKQRIATWRAWLRSLWMSSSSRVGLLDGARCARGLLSSCLVIAGLLVEIVECWRCVGDSLVEFMLLEVDVERVWFVFTRSTIMRERGPESGCPSTCPPHHICTRDSRRPHMTRYRQRACTC